MRYDRSQTLNRTAQFSICIPLLLKEGAWDCAVTGTCRDCEL
jgi:hypothetical protein